MNNTIQELTAVSYLIFIQAQQQTDISLMECYIKVFIVGFLTDKNSYRQETNKMTKVNVLTKFFSKSDYIVKFKIKHCLKTIPFPLCFV